MKNLSLTISSILILLCYTSAYTQSVSDKFGEISQADFDYIYEDDPSAKAIILFDKGETSFIRNGEGHFEILFERKKRIKIVSKGGTDYGNIEINAIQNENGIEDIYSIKGHTYNLENGNIVKSTLSKKDIFTEKEDKSYILKKIAMPQVKEGSIIEWSYKISSPFLFHFRSWYFQDNIPTVKSFYTARMIPFFAYACVSQEIDSLDHKKIYDQQGFQREYGNLTYRDKVCEFGMNNVPAFENNEKFITSQDDYIKKLIFQLSKVSDPHGSQTQYSTTWKKLVGELERKEDFGFYINASRKKGKKIISEELGEISSFNDLEKFNKILSYIKETISWNGYYFRYSSQKISELLKNKTGYSADINLFAIGLMRAAGLKSNAVLISTRDHGRIFYQHPFRSSFNNVVGVVNLDGKDFFFDATEPQLSNYLIPANCLNESGLRIDKEDISWYNMGSKNSSGITKNIFIDPLIEKDSLGFSINKTYSRYDAFSIKQQYLDDLNEIKKSVLKNGHHVKGQVKTSNYEEPEKPYSIKYKAMTQMESFNDKIIIKPFLNEVISKNHLKNPSRTYPVDFNYKMKRTFSSTVLIPKGYKVINLPSEIDVSSNLASISYKVLKLQNSITIQGYYEFKKSKYPVEDYTKLKNHYKSIVEKFNQELVLEKSS